MRRVWNRRIDESILRGKEKVKKKEPKKVLKGDTICSLQRLCAAGESRYNHARVVN